MIILIQRQRPVAHHRERRDLGNEEPHFEVADLEGYPRSGPHRICFDGGFRGRGCWRYHAERGTEHQHHLQQDFQHDDPSSEPELAYYLLDGWAGTTASLPALQNQISFLVKSQILSRS